MLRRGKRESKEKPQEEKGKNYQRQMREREKGRGSESVCLSV